MTSTKFGRALATATLASVIAVSGLAAGAAHAEGTDGDGDSVPNALENGFGTSGDDSADSLTSEDDTAEGTTTYTFKVTSKGSQG